jgi:cytochrome c551/c552
MKKILTAVIVSAMVSSAGLMADGAAVFGSKGCKSCHHATKDQLASGMGPSLQMVSTAYKANGGKAALEKFLKGEGQAIVAPKKFSVMKPQLAKTKGLNDADRGALADFILSN